MSSEFLRERVVLDELDPQLGAEMFPPSASSKYAAADLNSP